MKKVFISFILISLLVLAEESSDCFFKGSWQLNWPYSTSDPVTKNIFLSDISINTSFNKELYIYSQLSSNFPFIPQAGYTHRPHYMISVGGRYFFYPIDRIMNMKGCLIDLIISQNLALSVIDPRKEQREARRSSVKRISSPYVWGGVGIGAFSRMDTVGLQNIEIINCGAGIIFNVPSIFIEFSVNYIPVLNNYTYISGGVGMIISAY
ncbi:MAG: hypothetical protein SVK54_07175 [candidate division WOR-3 bacterium]|nr:hypothetical protein [candidate division WOR-3 bacterium]